MKYLVITDRPEEDYENCLTVMRFESKEELEDYLVLYDSYQKDDRETIEIYEINKKINYTVKITTEVTLTWFKEY